MSYAKLPQLPVEQRILVIDCGSQVTQLIVRRLRQLHVFAELVPFQHLPNIWQENMSSITNNINGIIISGSPSSVLQPAAPLTDVVSQKILATIITKKIPLLGICYGQQLLAHILGGRVIRGDNREFGATDLEVLTSDHPLLQHITHNKITRVWMSHGDHVLELPKGFQDLAKTQNAPHAIMGDDDRKIYGLQFHPEVSHTESGLTLLKNFVFNIIGQKANWRMGALIPKLLAEIKAKVGDKRVIAGLSGGVDSSVATVLAEQALPNQLTCIFVDHGLLRLGEADEIKNIFAAFPNLDFRYVDASQEFLTELHGIIDPEAKRKIIGKLFIKVFEREAKKIPNVEFLLQGTLYPDVIESVSFSGAPTSKIKSHHNVGGLPETMGLKLLEPLRLLFKDEVRELGRALALPESLIERHPFPGPGLAIRIIGEVTQEYCDLLRAVDDIYIAEIKNAGLYNKIWQAFAVLLPIRTVGVMGDSRSYDKVVALRAVTSEDGMTCDSFYFSEDFLKSVCRRIVNEVKGISRVVMDVTSKPPATIEWE